VKSSLYGSMATWDFWGVNPFNCRPDITYNHRSDSSSIAIQRAISKRISLNCILLPGRTHRVNSLVDSNRMIDEMPAIVSWMIGFPMQFQNGQKSKDPH
jgi:hypothetical protein